MYYKYQKDRIEKALKATGSYPANPNIVSIQNAFINDPKAQEIAGDSLAKENVKIAKTLKSENPDLKLSLDTLTFMLHYLGEGGGGYKKGKYGTREYIADYLKLGPTEADRIARDYIGSNNIQVSHHVANFKAHLK
jgi:hypothetical protein